MTRILQTSETQPVTWSHIAVTWYDFFFSKYFNPAERDNKKPCEVLVYCSKQCPCSFQWLIVNDFSQNFSLFFCCQYFQSLATKTDRHRKSSEHKLHLFLSEGTTTFSREHYQKKNEFRKFRHSLLSRRHDVQLQKG